jgi:hypothetical protein
MQFIFHNSISGAKDKIISIKGRTHVFSELMSHKIAVSYF